MNKIQVWTLASRPKTLTASLCPILIGSALAGSFNPFIFAFTLLTALAIQIGTNLANDYFDFIKGADTAARKGPMRVTQAGLASPRAMKWAMCCAFGIAAISGLFLVYQGGLGLILLLAISILLGLLYTAGPYPLAYLGLGDLFVFFFFGPIATAGTAYLQTGLFDPAAALAGIGPGALSTAIICVNNLRDVNEDRAANKKTLIVRFGTRFGKLEYVAMIVVAALVPLFFFDSYPRTLLASLIVIPAIPLIRTLGLISSHLAKTSLLLLVYTLLFCMGVLF
jgi:1,4-dihydroxy-2-naphthoate octaprenyltransferase